MSALLAFFFILGALVASFVTVISERVFTGRSWLSGRSECNSCRVTLAARDLIPILSWAFARGRCRACGSRVPYQYLLIEAVLGALFAFAYARLGLSFPLLFFLVALSILAFIVLYDLRHTVIPLLASFILFVAALTFAWLAAPDVHAFGLTLIVAGALSLFLFLLHALSRGRAMGLGDAPVAFSLALLTGASLAFPGLLFSFWIGALFGIGILLARRGGPTMGIEVPFAPFLAAGFLLAYFTQWNPLPLLPL